ncbi:LacI family DNA-binding transcriptional regulator [Bifidobacterium imperatoris]|uniref:LacI family DNA-binding transcriptional regulator n=2 Tax=Bifidobacterium imperatoris TaxID=2020965 RepID=A0A2N5IT89_9BIFI|nr:LacI family DNA-binding transcriptional regulator [Bifidobacterium imperatoris]PLS25179.1 transcriptional regulator, LacI family [Bifidobacterium imperatoris]QSY57708.1 LacI family DNA-binding transcriptional regulator [Bifidobacterium imperatoris]
MVTMQDVAKRAGVSKATVSYVLSNSPLITEKTAAKVRKAMDELGYSVNHMARSLSTSRTDTICIVSPALQGNSFSLSMCAYLYALSAAAHNMGYDSLLLTNDSPQALAKAIDARKFDGAILLEVRDNDPRVKVLQQTKFPGVLLGKPRELGGLDYVDSNFEGAASQLVDILADAGHREVLLVGWPRHTYDSGLNFALRFRDTAMIRARERGMDLHMVYSDNEVLGSDLAVKQALLAFPDATAMIIHNDAALVSAQQVFKDLEVEVPDDISVVTLAPDQMATGMRMPFTSMSISLNEVAKSAVEVLDRRIRGHAEGEQCVLVDAQRIDAGSVDTPESND